MIKKTQIKDLCHINSNLDGDTFVGIKVDADDVSVHFPIGYQLSENENGIRSDIITLISVLKEYTERENRVLQKNKFNEKETIDFPINAYLEVIEYYLNFGYYNESKAVYKTGTKGTINWPRTFKYQIPLVQQNGSFVYTQMSVRTFAPQEGNLITKIHQYCVYESIKKMGWLYGLNATERPPIEFNENLFVSVLYNKLLNTYNDRQKKLFTAMIDMITYMDKRPNEKQLYYGTNRFEYVWESLIDTIFGEKNKSDYFPKAEWKIRKGKRIDSSALQPDTIMKWDGKLYVIDAKYYKFGITGYENHLPNSSSINKQITYAEYIDKYIKVDNKKIFNAFLMPFNSEKNCFGTKKTFENIGEATGKWRKSSKPKNYDRVQGIVMNTKTLLNGQQGNSQNYYKKELANCIEKGFE